MGKTKKFIDKKTAATFQVVHRSQRDLELIDGEKEVTPYVLVSKPHRKLSMNPNFVDPADKVSAEILPRDVLPGVESVVPQFNFKEMFFEADEEVMDALEADSEDGEFEELDDDFVVQANQFDDAEEDNFTNRKKVRFPGDEEEEEEYEEEEYDDRMRVDVERDKSKQTAQRQIFEERFENVLQSYGDDQIGELEEGLGGGINIEDLDDMLDDFLDAQAKDKVLLTGKQGKRHGIKEDEDANSEDSQEFIDGDENEEDEGGNFDTKSSRSTTSRPTKIWDSHIQKYLDGTADREKQKVEIALEESDEEEKWDCQSIVSTYSNLENHPKLIIEESQRKIKLSNKSGLPIGVLPTKPKKKETKEILLENKGVRRSRDETPEEKKLRKKAIKEERGKQREQKKELKVAFKTEKLIQQQQMTPTSGLSTIRIG